MSVVLNQPCNAADKKIYFIYNFMQVNDRVLILMYDDACRRLKKIPVDYNNGFWQTSTLDKYTDAETFNYIDNKLKAIFKQHDQLLNFKTTPAATMLADHALMLLGGCS